MLDLSIQTKMNIPSLIKMECVCYQKLITINSNGKILYAVADELSKGYIHCKHHRNWKLGYTPRCCPDLYECIINSMLKPQPQHIINALFENNFAQCTVNEKPACPVCRDILDQRSYTATMCGHVYCNNCLELLTSCAICRAT